MRHITTVTITEKTERKETIVDLAMDGRLFTDDEARSVALRWASYVGLGLVGSITTNIAHSEQPAGDFEGE
jgi:hypothetical protein